MVSGELAAELTPDRLGRALAEMLGSPDVQVSDLRRLTAGASRETWAFRLGQEGGERPVVLRRDPPGDVRPGGIAREARLLEAAARAGVPVPGLVAWSGDGDVLDSPFLVGEWVDGETLGHKIVRDPGLAEVRPRLAADCGTLLARIHQIPEDAIPDLPDPGDPVAELASRLAAFADASVPFALALRWLELNRPPDGGRRVVHGDFRNGNLIVGPDGVRAVLDWELAHRGDPLGDLSWLCIRCWRFGGAGEVGGFGDREDLLRSYEATAGVAVSRDAFFWWEVLGTLRWGVMCLEMAGRHLSGAERSLELAAIGRRVREQEYDLMTMLDRGPAPR